MLFEELAATPGHEQIECRSRTLQQTGGFYTTSFTRKTSTVARTATAWEVQNMPSSRAHATAPYWRTWRTKKPDHLSADIKPIQSQFVEQRIRSISLDADCCPHAVVCTMFASGQRIVSNRNGRSLGKPSDASTTFNLITCGTPTLRQDGRRKESGPGP